MRITLLLVLLLSVQLTLGQGNEKQLPFIIKGQLTNCPEKTLNIGYRTHAGETVLDTLHLDHQGNFYLKTTKVKEPMLATIQRNRISINDFFVAPGYELTLTGNATDFNTLYISKKISGIGAESNRYRFMIDSINANRVRKNWFDLDKDALPNHLKKEQALEDSVATVVFKRKAVNDPYLTFFETMVRYDNMFMKLYALLAMANNSKFTVDETNAYIRQNFDAATLADLYNEKYMISFNYRVWIMTNEWPEYLATVESQKLHATDLHNNKLKRVFDTYPGGFVKQYVLTNLMEGRVEYAKSFADLNRYRKEFNPYISSIKNEQLKARVYNKFSQKEQELTRSQVGQPAPSFSLKSNFGDVHNLADFKGKVVYLDLWASWCKPCRAEVPSFKELYKKYKSDSRVVFIGIAVDDGFNEWKKALEKDKPDWLQLIDDEDRVGSAYVANFIPKFILIDKAGNIVSFDAPRPSDGRELEMLIDQELVK